MKVTHNENTLLEGLAKSDRKAIETMYKDNFNMVQALIINNNGSAEDAKDVFQETLIILFQKVKAGGFELNCQLKTYIFSVSRRLWLKRLQQINRFSLSGDDTEVVAVEEEIADHEKRNQEFLMMEKALNSIGEPCKSLLESFYLQKKNMQEIASSFGYTNSDNAKTQKYKCLMRLKKLFFTQYKTDL